MISSKRARRPSSKFVIYAAIVGNLLVAATKFVAAAHTGSSAMLSEGVHSLVDTGNELLLLYGLHRATARPDRQHPLGYGREVYFWSFVVALLVFALGAGIAFYQGVAQVIAREPIENPSVNYIVLAFSAMFDGATWWIALRNFKGRKPYGALFRAVRDSKDPPSFMVLFEDSAALIGLLIAFAGCFLSVSLRRPELDGVASILIGVVLALTAVVLARETKGLLIGESADPSIIDAILRLAGEIDGVANANGVLTIHLAPDQILVALSLEFADNLTTPMIEARVLELEQRLHASHPSVVAIFVKPQTPDSFKTTFERRFGQSPPKRQPLRRGSEAEHRGNDDIRRDVLD
ncbi:cation diffusion facilitator family transporter [Methylocella tundrae]|uniref:Cation diffusion facilitator transporter family protein n=1 Tax=Methylocella tundrae TaxID=227605 RepID=A0A4V6IN82_METTU|nr:cation diffusion facilitator family transporter [Methylocella tundrae]WPP02879.1 cation diffusion facilitator family transporter [Methylocella tundrae]VFU16504.1 Cation diffusion facilitator transporter family protein [Methylocella tundrae]